MHGMRSPVTVKGGQKRRRMFSGAGISLILACGVLRGMTGDNWSAIIDYYEKILLRGDMGYLDMGLKTLEEP